MAGYLITGVSRGIGRALAQRLIANGNQVHGIVRSVGSVEGLALAGVVELDLADFAGYRDALQPLLSSLDSLDGLVHCAGIVRPGTLAEAVPADFTDQFNVNVIAAAELVRLAAPALRAAAGTVVLVNSGSGLNARSPLASYGASKYALRGYAEALRQDEPGIRVCTIYPGRTSTEMQQAVRTAEAGSYDEAAYLKPSTVAGVIASVLSLPADATITDLTVRPAAQPGPSSPDAA
ncbi:MAG: SDR family oxidoreductase [Jatrophihabitantaceae bacterium]